MADNPLAAPQRETSGARTFAKYQYQYHWALCRIIDAQKQRREYALFMELHEDVILSDSLDAEAAQFEFSQVKNVGKPRYTLKALTKKKASGESILGKLVSSAASKPFSHRVSKISLVASCGFKLANIENALNLEVISVGDLERDALSQLSTALQEEVGSECPECLEFVVPDLGVANQQDATIGRVARLVTELFPDAHCNPNYIYRSLIDDLYRKGTVEYDFKDWDDLLARKALTSEQVSRTISSYVQAGDRRIRDDASNIARALGLNYMQSKRLLESIESIYVEAVGFPTALSIQLRNCINSALDELFYQTDDVAQIIEEVQVTIPAELAAEVVEQNGVRDRIIYEILRR